jgi:hypothetical protein
MSGKDGLAACESLANKLGVRLVFTAPVDSERTK